MSATLEEIETKWSINDQEDALEYIRWTNARTHDAQDKAARKRADDAAAKKRG